MARVASRSISYATPGFGSSIVTTTTMSNGETTAVGTDEITASVGANADAVGTTTTTTDVARVVLPALHTGQHGGPTG